MGLTPEKLVALATQSAKDKKASHVVILNLKGLSPMTDYFAICSGESELHVRAIANQIIEDLEQQGESPWHVEGYSRGTWILLDYVDVVVHVFSQKIREYYALERLWGDAPVHRVSLEK